MAQGPRDLHHIDASVDVGAGVRVARRAQDAHTNVVKVIASWGNGISAGRIVITVETASADALA